MLEFDCAEKMTTIEGDQKMTTATKSLRILGITDEKTECECCGKANLKCTVAIEHLDGDGNGTGSIMYYGRDCAARTMYGSNKSGNVAAVESVAKAIEYAKKWLRATEKHTAKVVANAIRVRFTAVHECGEFALKFNNGVVVAK